MHTQEELLEKDEDAKPTRKLFGKAIYLIIALMVVVLLLFYFMSDN